MLPGKTEQKKVIVVTGTTRGIGLGIIERLLESEGASDILIIATARTKSPSIENIYSTHPVAKDSLIFYPDLDLSDQESIRKFGEYIKTVVDHVDILINNAGYSHCENGEEENILEITKKTFEINVYAPMRMVDVLMKLFVEGSHIINISSRYGTIKFKNEERRRQFLEFENVTPEIFERMVEEFYKSSANHSWEKDNWINGAALDNVYSVSKAFLNLYTRMLDKKLKDEKVNIKVNCCHPGHCKTDMGGPNAPLTYRDGAETPLWLANFPRDFDPALSGNYYVEKIPTPFYV